MPKAKSCSALAATVNAHLAVDIKRKGAASLFIRPSPGLYALNPSPSPTSIPSNLWIPSPAPVPAHPATPVSATLSFPTGRMPGTSKGLWL